MARRPVDVLFVSLGSTFGLRTADDQLAGLLRDEGLAVEVTRPPAPRDVRTLALTDLVQARACARAARDALGEVEPRALLFGSSTAALAWPGVGAIRFDALAQRTRPGRHGPWQRPLERRRLRQAPLLLPWSAGSLEGAPAGVGERAVVLPVALDAPAVDRAAHEVVDAILRPIGESGRRAVATTYAADPVKKGLDRLVPAFVRARREHEVLLVAGHGALPARYARVPGVVDVGRLDRAAFRALVRATGLLATAPRREDYGLVQLEALAEGARVVTTAAPGPYAALPVIRELWPGQVVDDGDDEPALAVALRSAIDARPDPAEHVRIAAAVAPWSRDAVRAVLRDRVIPALLDPRP